MQWGGAASELEFPVTRHVSLFVVRLARKRIMAERELRVLDAMKSVFYTMYGFTLKVTVFTIKVLLTNRCQYNFQDILTFI